MKARQKGNKRNSEADSGLLGVISELQAEIANLKRSNEIYKNQISELQTDIKTLEKQKREILKFVKQSAKPYEKNKRTNFEEP